MAEDKNTYRQIMKTTSIFGGVQVIQIFIGIIRSKFIAILLGPEGMGISGLLQAGTGFIEACTSFGLSNSAIKSISSAQAEDNDGKISLIISVFRKLVWITGLLGLFVTLLLAPILSQVAFGNKEYTWAFALLSTTLLLNQLSSGQIVLLRALRQVRLMSRASIIGSIIGLVTTIPFYYYCGIKGIVPALIITSISSLIVTRYFANKISVNRIKVTISDIKSEGKEMLNMGFVISFSIMISLAFSYLIRIFISSHGSVNDVGLYNAGFAIVNTYVGMIFTSLATDYYPKLSGLANNLSKTNQAINQQLKIAIAILGPIILIFMVFIQWVVQLLYSQDFLPINHMILFAAAGMHFKAIGWAIAYLFLAKSNSKQYFWNELLNNIYVFAFNILGFYYFGLDGLGISFLLTSGIYAMHLFFIARRLYDFQFDREFLSLILLNMLFTLITLFMVLKMKNIIFLYTFGIVIIIVSSVFNFYFLDKKMGVLSRIFRNK